MPSNSMHLAPTSWSQGGRTPDLLNAIQTTIASALEISLFMHRSGPTKAGAADGASIVGRTELTGIRRRRCPPGGTARCVAFRTARPPAVLRRPGATAVVSVRLLVEKRAGLVVHRGGTTQLALCDLVPVGPSARRRTAAHRRSRGRVPIRSLRQSSARHADRVPMTDSAGCANSAGEGNMWIGVRARRELRRRLAHLWSPYGHHRPEIAMNGG